MNGERNLLDLPDIRSSSIPSNDVFVSFVVEWEVVVAFGAGDDEMALIDGAASDNLDVFASNIVT